MPILIGAGLAIILAAVYVAFSMSRFRESAGAMEQTARELLTRLQSVEARLGETEDTLAKNLTAMRREQNETAAAGRAEQARNFAVLGDAQAKRVMEIGSVQRDSFQNFAKQLAALGEAQAARIKEISESQTESLAAFSNQLANISRLNEDKLESDALDRRGKTARAPERQRREARKDARDGRRAAARDARKKARRGLQHGLRAA